MELLISVRDLLNFIMYFLGGTALIIFIIALIYVIKFVKRLDKLVEKNADNIDKTVSVLPEVADNINAVSLSLKNGIDKAEQTVEAIEDYVCDTVTTVSQGTEGILDFVGVVSEVIKSVLGFFSSGKK